MYIHDWKNDSQEVSRICSVVVVMCELLSCNSHAELFKLCFYIIYKNHNISTIVYSAPENNYAQPAEDGIKGGWYLVSNQHRMVQEMEEVRRLRRLGHKQHGKTFCSPRTHQQFYSLHRRQSGYSERETSLMNTTMFSCQTKHGLNYSVGMDLHRDRGRYHALWSSSRKFFGKVLKGRSTPHGPKGCIPHEPKIVPLSSNGWHTYPYVSPVPPL